MHRDYHIKLFSFYLSLSAPHAYIGSARADIRFYMTCHHPFTIPKIFVREETCLKKKSKSNKAEKLWRNDFFFFFNFVMQISTIHYRIY